MRASKAFLAFLFGGSSLVPHLANASFANQTNSQRLACIGALGSTPSADPPAAQTPPGAAEAEPAPVEIEVNVSPVVLRMITTLDGTVGPVLDALSDEDRARALRRFAGLRTAGDVRSMLWDDVPHPTKLALLRLAAANRIRSLDLPFLRARSPLLTEIQLRSYGDMRNFRGVEMHYMGETQPAAAVVSAWRMLDREGIGRVPLHVHLLRTFPKDLFLAAPRSTILRIADLGQRADLLAQYVGLKLGYSLRTNEGAFGVAPAPLLARFFSGMHDGLLAAFSRGSSLRHKRQPSWVSVRRPVETYRNPSLWGLEYRALVPQYSDGLATLVLGALHSAMNEAQWPLSESVSHRWLAYSPSQGSGPPSVERILYAGWYNRDVLLDSWARRLLANPTLGTITDPELRMVLHDWNLSTLTDGSEALQTRIKTVQTELSSEIVCNPNCTAADPKRLAVRFLEQSGLIQSVAESLGIHWQELQARLRESGGS